MTCVVACTDGRSAALGIDAASSLHGGTVTMVNRRKLVTRKRGLLIASCGLQLFVDELERWQPPDRGGRAAGDWISEVAVSLRHHFMDQHRVWDVSRCDDGGGIAGAFLAVIDASIFYLSGAWCVSEPDTGYWAVGSGSEFALGALHAMHFDADLTPTNRVARALRAAELFDTATTGPFDIEVSKPAD